MLSHVVKWSVSAALTIAVLALPAPAAPVIKSGGQTLKIDKYLLDDVDGVLVVDVKQIMASPVYKKSFQKQLSDLIARPEVQVFLKDAGFDPLKEVERVIICNSRSCHRAEIGTPGDDGPFLLFQGKVDAAKVKAKMASLAKEHPDWIAGSDAPGGEKVYRIGPRHGPYVAQLDANTVVMAGMKTHVLAALDKAAGKKTTKLVHKDISNYLNKFKPDVAIQGFALEPMVFTTSYETADNGMGQRVIKAKIVTLGEKGFKDAVLRINIKDDARGSVVWTVKDKDKVKPLTEMFTQGLEQARGFIRAEAGRRPQLEALSRFFDGVTIKSSGQSITMEGKADADVVQALILSLGIVG
jgi:hypothetical protein